MREIQLAEDFKAGQMPESKGRVQFHHIYLFSATGFDGHEKLKTWACVNTDLTVEYLTVQQMQGRVYKWLSYNRHEVNLRQVKGVVQALAMLCADDNPLVDGLPIVLRRGDDVPAKA